MDRAKARNKIRQTLDGFGVDVHGGEAPDLASAISQIVDYLDDLEKDKETMQYEVTQ
jgi:hypothetical protein